MAVDHGDLSTNLEPVSIRPQRMLFHVSNANETGIDFMKKHGLLADSPTLTPRVDIGTYYSGGNFLTFWYPKRREVDSGRGETKITPTLPVTSEKKAEMLRDLEEMGIEGWRRIPFEYTIKKAETFLPGERLRAVAEFSGQVTPLEWIFPEDTRSFIEFYNVNKESLPIKVKKALDKMQVRFLDPALTKDILAEDIVKTYVEHNLLALGSYHGYPNDTKKGLESRIVTLQDGTFDDPVWERYRQMLISRFQRRLAELPVATETD